MQDSPVAMLQAALNFAIWGGDISPPHIAMGSGLPSGASGLSFEYRLANGQVSVLESIDSAIEGANRPQFLDESKGLPGKIFIHQPLVGHADVPYHR